MGDARRIGIGIALTLGRRGSNGDDKRRLAWKGRMVCGLSIPDVLA